MADQTLLTLRMSRQAAEVLGRVEIGSLVGQWLDVAWCGQPSRAKITSVQLSGDEVAVTLAVHGRQPTGEELGQYSIAPEVTEQ